MPLLAGFEGPAIFDAEGGAIRAAAAVAALAGRLGQSLVYDEVVALWPNGARARWRSARRAGAASTGRWWCAPARTPPGWPAAPESSIPIEVSLHGRLTFKVAGAPHRRSVACLLDSSDAFGEPGVYGAPSPGSSRFSIGVNGRRPWAGRT